MKSALTLILTLLALSGTTFAQTHAAGKARSKSGEPLTMDEDQNDHTGWYGGAGLGAYSLDIKGVGLSTSFSTFGGFGQLGYAFTENIAVEGRFGATSKDTRNFVTDPAVFGLAIPFSLDVQSDHFFTLLLRASTSDLGAGMRIYGLLGASSIHSTARFNFVGVPLLDASGDDTSVTYGAGVEKEITKSISLGVEYVRYYTETTANVKTDLDGVSGVARFKF